MILSAIAAMSENRVIGQEGKLPWHVPEDLKHFKTTTLGKPVIMGRKTYDSLGRLLPGRENIIVTRNKNFQVPKAVVFSSLQDAIEYCKKKYAADDEVFIIGGGEIYTLSLPYLDRIYLTIIHAHFDGDAYFPAVDLQNDFQIQSEKTETSAGTQHLKFTIIRADKKR